MKPPLAPSTWIGMSQPFSCLTWRSSSSIPSISSIWPVKVVPRIAPTAIVFSSMCGFTSSGPMMWRSGVSGITRCSTSK